MSIQRSNVVHNLIPTCFFKLPGCKTIGKFHGPLALPKFLVLVVVSWRSQRIAGNEELRGMSLSLFLDPPLINFPCSLLAQVLATVQNAKEMLDSALQAK